jgi:hypothetical protein
MKTFMTTAAILAVLTAPVFAQTGTESRGEPNAAGAKESAKDPAEKGAMGQGQAVPRAATTGAASDPTKKDPSKESAGSGTNVGEKTGVTTGGGSK